MIICFTKRGSLFPLLSVCRIIILIPADIALQFAYPSYVVMLGHLRSKAFENFKKRLEHSMNDGEGFASAVLKCTKTCMLEFDQGSAGEIAYHNLFYYSLPCFLEVHMMVALFEHSGRSKSSMVSSVYFSF